MYKLKIIIIVRIHIQKKYVQMMNGIHLQLKNQNNYIQNQKLKE